MTRALHRRLTVLLVALLALGWGLSATARMPSADDLALAQFVALGGTADDLCTKGDAQAVLDGLSKVCAPSGAPLLAAPGLLVSGLVRVPRRLGRRLAGARRPVSQHRAGPAIRGPPRAA